MINIREKLVEEFIAQAYCGSYCPCCKRNNQMPCLPGCAAKALENYDSTFTQKPLPASEQKEENMSDPNISPVKPTVGRIVHYYSEDSKRNANGGIETVLKGPYAAIITGVESGVDGVGYVKKSVHLTVFRLGDNAAPLMEIPYSPTPKAGHWSWPEKA